MSIDPLAVSGMCLRKLSSAKYPSFFSVMETEMAESVLVFKKTSTVNHQLPFISNWILCVGRRCMQVTLYKDLFFEFSESSVQCVAACYSFLTPSGSTVPITKMSVSPFLC